MNFQIPGNMQTYSILSYTLRSSVINILFNIISVTLLQFVYLRWGNKTSDQNSLKIKSCRLFCVSSPRRVTCSPWQVYKSFWTISLWRNVSSPRRNIRHWPKQLAWRDNTRLAKFFSPEPYFRHECSPPIRHGELMQNGPCFTKIIKFMWFHLHSSFKTVQKHNTYNME